MYYIKTSLTNIGKITYSYEFIKYMSKIENEINIIALNYKCKYVIIKVHLALPIYTISY